jgi:hypothetical protein
VPWRSPSPAAGDVERRGEGRRRRCRHRRSPDGVGGIARGRARVAQVDGRGAGDAEARARRLRRTRPAGADATAADKAASGRRRTENLTEMEGRPIMSHFVLRFELPGMEHGMHEAACDREYPRRVTEEQAGAPDAQQPQPRRRTPTSPRSGSPTTSAAAYSSPSRGCSTGRASRARQHPRTGKVILASNHLSFIDSLIIPMFAPRCTSSRSRRTSTARASRDG